MPALSLPFASPEPPVVTGEAPGLVEFLSPPNAPGMVSRMGEETVRLHQGDAMVVEGERYAIPGGWIQGRRYLALRGAGEIVGALNVTVRKEGRKTTAVASNVVVAEAHRRQGIASELFARARAEFPALVADIALTPDGAALLGQGPGPRKKPRP